MGDAFDASLSSPSKIDTSFTLDFDPMSYTLKESPPRMQNSDLDEFDPLHSSNDDIQADSLETPIIKHIDYHPQISENGHDSLIQINNSQNGHHVFQNFEDGKEFPGYSEDDDEESPECVVEPEGSESDSLVPDNLDEVTMERPEGLISVAKLKSSYTQNTMDQSLTSPQKETIETGIKIASIKSTLGSPSDDSLINRENDCPLTGISVRSLSTTFSQNSPQRVEEESPLAVSPVEEFQLSIDKEKLALKFSQNGSEEITLCKICGKTVYQMEKIYAEKNAFHKFCFRCSECKKTLNVDTYCSHNGQLFCKPHFRQLFQPQAKFILDLGEKQTIEDSCIKENTPEVLPPEVVRSDSKADDGIEKIPDLSNLRSKFETQQSGEAANHSPSLDVPALDKLGERMAKYQSRASGDSMDNNDLSEEEELKETVSKEKPIPVNMSSLKSQWESGSIKVPPAKEEKTEELAELEQLRPILHSESFKSMYVNACQEANKMVTSRSEHLEMNEDTRKLRDKFEKGDLVNELDSEKQEKTKKEKEDDLSYTSEELNISTDARNKFKQIDAAGAKPPTPTSPVKMQDFSKLITSTPKVAPEKAHHTKNGTTNGSDVVDAEIVRAIDAHEEIPTIDTTKRMLGLFQSLESKPDVVMEGNKTTYKNEESIQVEADITKNLKAKFEKWENVAQENKKNEDINTSQKSLTRNLRAMFENSRDEEASPAKEKPKTKVNRFIEQQANMELCAICQKKLYPMEKMETSGLRLHKNCFRCVHCSCILRLENYTTSGGKLYCTTHFKQLFISKGNYDEGFGREQHKEKWNRSRSNTPVSRSEEGGLYTALDVVA